MSKDLDIRDIMEKDVVTIEDDKTALEFNTDNTGSYYFELSPLATYEIIVSKDDYVSNKSTISTVGLRKSQDLIKDLQLVPIKKEIILPKVYYDFAKWDLRDTSLQDLDMVYDILIENPNITIELNSHTDFRGNDNENLVLSQKRADACIEYLVSKGISNDRLSANGMGESMPFVIEEKDGRFKVGDVLTELYISKIKFKKNKEKAHQYNRRTTFRVNSEDYMPPVEDNN